ncbi:molybdate transport system ATP-binding protein [Paucimonas lemoignei]|uniref:Molybdate transport system ATP-binding protein n=1 Tax=Paucimonas lemoignei TaxID=29443 RepID=A0A4R3I0E6_PAULE|nr:ATP-binding cassette domain-containing protein [Paucimonas lemoignei]TCS39157.1 molybdate transport system ATP-binding protein [Paucimonas lemoignei]
MLFDIDIAKELRSGRRKFELRLQFRTDSRRVVILGPSGAGKSLSLQAIAGLLQPDCGYIHIEGRKLFDSTDGIDLAPQERQLAYLFQDYALFPHLNVRQNIAFGLTRGWRNPPADVGGAEVDYWLDAFGLRRVAQQIPSELSGGQRQRTALARALAAKPRALLLDEPFAALDTPLRVSLRQELDQLQRRLNVPMVMITHDMEDAAVFGDEILQLKDGAIVAADGDADDAVMRREPVNNASGEGKSGNGSWENGSRDGE